MLDFIGVGLGPFNLSLAALLHQHEKLNYRFLINVQDLTGIRVCNCQMPCCRFHLWPIW